MAVKVDFVMLLFDFQGVTIPSQRRYVGYYATLVQENLEYQQVVLCIRDVYLEPIPHHFSGNQGRKLTTLFSQSILDPRL